MDLIKHWRSILLIAKLLIALIFIIADSVSQKHIITNICSFIVFWKFVPLLIFYIKNSMIWSLNKCEMVYFTCFTLNLICEEFLWLIQEIYIMKVFKSYLKVHFHYWSDICKYLDTLYWINLVYIVLSTKASYFCKQATIAIWHNDKKDKLIL